MKREFLIGLVGVVGIALVCFLIFLVEDFEFKGYRLYSYFDDVGGLEVGADVKFCGVDVGKVKSVEFEDSKVKVGMIIRNGIKIPSDSVVTIEFVGLMGEKYIEIYRGQSSDFADDNQILESKKPISVAAMLDRFQEILHTFSDSFKELRSMLKEINIQQMRQEIVKLSDELLSFLKESQRLIKELSFISSKIKQDYPPLQRKVSKFLDDLNKISDLIPSPSTKVKIEEAILNIHKASEKISPLLDNLNKISDLIPTSCKVKIQETISNIHRISQDLSALAEDLRKHPWKLLRKK